MNPSRAWRVSEIANTTTDSRMHFDAAEAHSRMAAMFGREGNEFEAAKHMAVYRAHITMASRFAR